jgi:hypothetical protein
MSTIQKRNDLFMAISFNEPEMTQSRIMVESGILVWIDIIGSAIIIAQI